MSKLSLNSSPSSLALTSLPASHIPSHLAHSLPPYGPAIITAVTKVCLGADTYVYHAETWRGHRLPHTMEYESLNSMATYALHLAPLARTIDTTENGETRQQYELVLPPYTILQTISKVTHGVDPDFDGAPHQITHYDVSAADIWATAFLLNPDHLLFQIHRIQNGRRLHRGSIVKAPSAWVGDAVVVEKVGELIGWTLLEFRLLTSRKIIYVRALSDLVAMDRTCGGQCARWMRIQARRVWGTYNDEKYARLLSIAANPPDLTPMGMTRPRMDPILLSTNHT
ncbi:hypothetical protein DFH07DRAFT_957856 [Mycena maculata]|uniref:Uncharacterized protein n=1 Tax=Mycena maculata TaxID=230809 RepID=A0AAD7NFC3_9AGAR|nr:hypothetical protein DFH07DRAFT_957856 [Mycena maculata]